MLGALVLVLTVALGALGWQLVDSDPATSSRVEPEVTGRDSTHQPSPGSTATAVAPSPSAVGAGHDRWPLPFEGTGTVLLFDDGLSGGVLVDVDTGRAIDVELPGQRPGGQPFRLWRMGGWVVVGWGEIVALDIGGRRPVRQLGEATVFLPAAEPNRLWLVDHPDGRSSPATWTLVDASGQALHQSVGVVGVAEPLRGVPGGLALRRDDGSLARYDLDSGEVTDYLDDDAYWIVDVTRDRVLWCEDPCRQLRLSDPAGRTVATFGDDGDTFSPQSAWLSGDGSRVGAAVAVDVDGGGGVDRRIRIYDVDAEQHVADAQLPLGHLRGSWTLDGLQFFYWLNAQPESDLGPAELGHWAAGGRFEQVDVASQGRGLHGFVTLPRATMDDLLPQGSRDD